MMSPMFLVSYSFFVLSCTSDYDIHPQKPDIHPADITECDFIPVKNTRMSQYSCNPILTEEIEEMGIQSIGFSVTEVQGHPFYQIWYHTPSTEFTYTLNYAVSTDGIQWTQHEQNPVLVSDLGMWDQDMMTSHVIFWDDEQQNYVLAYQGITFGIDDYGRWGMGIATSTDGVQWVKHPENPVIDFIEDFYRVVDSEIHPCWPLSIQKHDGGYTGYISASIVGSSQTCQMYSFSSQDLVHWTINSQTPVLLSGFSYDKMGFADAAIVDWFDIETQTHVLYMFYIGFSDFIQQENYHVTHNTTLGLAISHDNGQTWEKDPNNPIPIHLTSPAQISSVDARVVGSRIHIWVGDVYENRGGIGYFYYEPQIEPHP